MTSPTILDTFYCPSPSSWAWRHLNSHSCQEGTFDLPQNTGGQQSHSSPLTKARAVTPAPIRLEALEGRAMCASSSKLGVPRCHGLSCVPISPKAASTKSGSSGSLINACGLIVFPVPEGMGTVTPHLLSVPILNPHSTLQTFVTPWPHHAQSGMASAHSQSPPTLT